MKEDDKRKKELENSNALAVKYFKMACEDAQKLYDSGTFFEGNTIACVIENSLCLALVTFVDACIKDKTRQYIVKKELKDHIDSIWEELEERKKTQL